MAHVEVSVEDGLATITLNRPPLNVLTTAMLEQIGDALETIGANPEVRLLRLDARGKCFSAGVDVGDHLGDKVETMMDALARLFDRFAALAVPSVSVVHAAALGGGCEVCLGTDLCFASEAAKFGQPEIKLGLFAPPASVLLPRRIGPGRAMSLLLSGETIDAREAERIGLVDRLFPADEFEARVTEKLDEMLSYSGVALTLAKRAVTASLDRPAGEAHAAVDRIYRAELMRSEDAHEGLDAFMNKRAPRWKHR